MYFYLLLKIWVKVLVKIKAKTSVVNTAKSFLIVLNNLQQLHLKNYFEKSNSKYSRNKDLVGNKIADNYKSFKKVTTK